MDKNETIDVSQTGFDKSSDLDFFDPGDPDDIQEVQDNEADQGDVDTKGQDETDQTNELEAAQDQPEDDEEQGSEEDNPATEPEDGVLITLNDEQVTLSEIKAGYMKDQDYRLKTNEVSKYRAKLQAEQTRIANVIEKVGEFVAGFMPAEPDMSLATSAPGDYIAQKAQYDAAMSQFNVLIEQANQLKQSEQETADASNAYEQALGSMELAILHPEVTNPTGKAKFWEGVQRTAKQFGFTDEEVNATADHRILSLVHFAKQGMDAAAARRRIKQDAGDVPKARPARGKGRNVQPVTNNRKAMAKLGKTGSIKDALKVDFID